MTALLQRRTVGRAARRRFGRRDDARTTTMDELRERIERDDYAVDPQKVADAIVRRLQSQSHPRRDSV
jgi:anti-sigma28 factor (negative regulator of flagellin synthesis)